MHERLVFSVVFDNGRNGSCLTTAQTGIRNLVAHQPTNQQHFTPSFGINLAWKYPFQLWPRIDCGGMRVGDARREENKGKMRVKKKEEKKRNLIVRDFEE